MLDGCASGASAAGELRRFVPLAIEQSRPLPAATGLFDPLLNPPRSGHSSVDFAQLHCDCVLTAAELSVMWLCRTSFPRGSGMYQQQRHGPFALRTTVPRDSGAEGALEEGPFVWCALPARTVLSKPESDLPRGGRVSCLLPALRRYWSRSIKGSTQPPAPTNLAGELSRAV